MPDSLDDDWPWGKKNTSQDAGDKSTNEQKTQKLRVKQAYPNPFNERIQLDYSLIQEASNVEIGIYRLDGKRIEILYQGGQEAGDHTREWRPADLSAGIYLFKVEADNIVRTARITYIR